MLKRPKSQTEQTEQILHCRFGTRCRLRLLKPTLTRRAGRPVSRHSTKPSILADKLRPDAIPYRHPRLSHGWASQSCPTMKTAVWGQALRHSSLSHGHMCLRQSASRPPPAARQRYRRCPGCRPRYRRPCGRRRCRRTPRTGLAVLRAFDQITDAGLAGVIGRKGGRDRAARP